MNITITGRRFEVSDSLRDYVEKKVKKLEKYFNQLIDSHVVMYIDKLDHVAEITVNGDGVQFHGMEKAGDMYSSIDLLMDKMEKQVNRYKEKHSGHKAVGLGKIAEMEYVSDRGSEIYLSQVSNKPLGEVEAFLEMRVDKKDFILFKKGVNDVKTNAPDYSNKNYAVIFKNGEGFKMLEIPFEMIKESRFDADNFVSYDLEIQDESALNPKILFKKDSKSSVMKLTIDEALKMINGSDNEFLPFFNSETNYFNVIYKNGKRIEVMVPAY